jgi:hypothetical protein
MFPRIPKPPQPPHLNDRKRSTTVSLDPKRWTHIHLLHINAHVSSRFTRTLIPPPLSEAETAIILSPTVDSFPTFDDDELENLAYAAPFLDLDHNPPAYLRWLLHHIFYYPDHSRGPDILHFEHENRKMDWIPLVNGSHKGMWAVGPGTPKSHMAEEVGCFIAIMLASPVKSVAPLLFTVRHSKVVLLRACRNEEYLGRMLEGNLREQDTLEVEALAVWDLNVSEQRLELAKVATALARSEDIVGL